MKISWMPLIMILATSACSYKGVNSFPLDPVYPKYISLLDDLNSISNIDPKLAKHRIIGFTDTEHLPLYAVELGHGKRDVLIIGQHHADEVLGVAVALNLAKNLAEGYSKEKRIKQLLDEYKLWIVPTINPEGWRLVSSGVTKIKRKNNRDTDKNGKLDIRTDGVDLNRNYPIFWDLDGESNALSSYFKGPAPASETEVKSIIALGRRQDFELAIFYHSSTSGALNESIFLPAVDEPTPRFLALQDLAERYARAVPRDYQKGTYSLHLGSTSKLGNARNFFYHSLGVPAMLIEVGGVNKAGKSIIHPQEKMVKRIQKRHLEALIITLEAM